MNKVYFLIGAIPPQTGGELFNYKLFKHLESQGFEVECICLHKKLAVRLSRLPLLGNLLANIALAFWLYQCQGTLVIDHYFTKYLIFTNIIQRFFRKSKIIVLVHSLYGYDTSDNFLIRKFFNRLQHKTRLSLANLIITNSKYSLQEIVSLGIKQKLVHIIPPGIDREKLKIIPGINNHNKILCVANYLPGKGLINLIEAFSQINKKDFTLHLAGNSQKSAHYYQKLQKIVKKLNLTKEVFFHNGAEKENLYKLYSQANIFVLPTLKETFGIVLIEAMHYGLPIITTNVAAIPELVTDGLNGLLVPAKKTEALAEALSQLIQNSDLRDKMGKIGHQRVANFYSWEQTCSNFTSLLNLVGDAHPTSNS